MPYIFIIAKTLSSECSYKVDFTTFPTVAVHATKDNTQSVANNTSTVILYNGTTTNIGGYYSTSTGRFTPTIAGYYFVVGQARLQNSTSTIASMRITKNGTNITDANHQAVLAYEQMRTLCLVQLNGSTDYVDVRFYQDSGSSKTIDNNPQAVTLDIFRIMG